MYPLLPTHGPCVYVCVAASSSRAPLVCPVSVFHVEETTLPNWRVVST